MPGFALGAVNGEFEKGVGPFDGVGVEVVVGG